MLAVQLREHNLWVHVWLFNCLRSEYGVPLMFSMRFFVVLQRKSNAEYTSYIYSVTRREVLLYKQRV